MKNLLYVIMFLCGASAGVIITRGYFDKKYRELTNLELDEIRDYYKKRHLKCEEANENEDENVDSDYYKNRHLKREEANEDEKKIFNVAKKNDDSIYVITPEEFGELEEYSKISLTYYSDNILADELDEVITDIDKTVGENNLNRIGEYESGAIHIRNDIKMCDYEVLQDMRRYSDLYPN